MNQIPVDYGIVQRFMQNRNKKKGGKGPTRGQGESPERGTDRGRGNPKPPGQNLRKGRMGDWPINWKGGPGQSITGNDWAGQRDWGQKKTTPTKEMIKRRLAKRRALDS